MKRLNLFLLMSLLVAFPCLGQLTPISVAPDGSLANNSVTGAAISGDGRYVVFSSIATNLVNGDTNDKIDIFVRSLSANETTRILAPGGIEPNGNSRSPHISSNGRYIAFTSSATNLVPDDNNSKDDVFVYDRETRNIVRASVSTDSRELNNHSFLSYQTGDVITPDGRWVVFSTSSDNVVPGDDNQNTDIFLRDLIKNRTSRISTSSAGVQSNAFSTDASISRDGRMVSYSSFANNLVENDGNGVNDCFVFDRELYKTRRLGINTQNFEPQRGSFLPIISPDGLRVIWGTLSGGIVPDDLSSSTPDLFEQQLSDDSIQRIKIPGIARDNSGQYHAVSYNGRFILLSVQDIGGGYSQYLVDRAVNTSTLLSHSASPASALGFLDLSDDGRSAILVLNPTDVTSAIQGAPQVYLYENSVGDDLCPNDPEKLAPGRCGCGIPEVVSMETERVICGDSSKGGTAISVLATPLKPSVKVNGSIVTIALQEISGAKYTVIIRSARKIISKKSGFEHIIRRKLSSGRYSASYSYRVSVSGGVAQSAFSQPVRFKIRR